MIRVVHPDPDFLPIPDPGVKKDPRSASLPLPVIKVAVPSISAQKRAVQCVFLSDIGKGETRRPTAVVAASALTGGYPTESDKTYSIFL
jgi:hypothetical protein